MFMEVRIIGRHHSDNTLCYARDFTTFDLTADDLDDLYKWAKHPINEADLHDRAGEMIRNFQRLVGDAAKYARGDDL